MRSIPARLFTTILLLAVLALAVPSPAAAEDMCAEHTMVTIDIKPGSDSNKVKLSSQGLLPVAVLSTTNSDASLFSPAMAHLADATSSTDCSGAAAVRWSLEDVNSDGLPDLIFLFRVQDLSFTGSTTAATLMAHGTYDGTEIHIMGTDTVQVIP